MNKIDTFDQVPGALGLILEKLDKVEAELAELKAAYQSAPPLPDDIDRLLTIAEACEMLKVKPNSIHRWKREGKIPYRKVGTKTFFKKSDLENYNKIEVKKPKGLR